MLHQDTHRDTSCVYVSQLAAGFEFAEAERIIQAAHRRNAEHGIRGALVFDGERFAQLLVGPPAAVAALMGRIVLDVRHNMIQRLYDGPTALVGDVRRWSSGYCGRADLDAVADSGGGEPAVRALLNLIDSAVMF